MKQKIRSEVLLKRLQHHRGQKNKKDTKILAKLLQMAEIKKARSILFYLPIHGEVNLHELFEKLKARKKFILPRVKNESTLHLYYIQNLKDVEKGSFNIMEPKLHLKRAALKDVGVALVPGVVFAKNGHRIGYGKGFYDRLLKKLRIPKIGVAYEFQIVENIEGQSHDTPMDMIVTEKKVYRMRAARKPAHKKIL
jgi:5-formyltetrahydrofolate cyclo-ligase